MFAKIVARVYGLGFRDLGVKESGFWSLGFGFPHWRSVVFGAGRAKGVLG